MRETKLNFPDKFHFKVWGFGAMKIQVVIFWLGCDAMLLCGRISSLRRAMPPPSAVHFQYSHQTQPQCNG